MDHMHESHTMGSPSSNSPGYLPQYLLGGNSPAVAPLPRGRPVGSSLGSYKGSPGRTGPLSSPRSYPYHVNSPLRPQGLIAKADKTVPRLSSVGCTPKDSIGAPPVEGLYDARSLEPISNSPFAREQPMDVTMATVVDTSVRKSAGCSTPGSNVTFHGTESHSYSPQRGSSFSSPTQIDPFYTQGAAISSDDILDECWVTVFGFPPAASSFILKQFSQYGNIIRSVTSKGNWIHIQYQSKLQAKKALSKNGKVYGSDIMGVMEASGKEDINGSPLRLETGTTVSTSINKSAPMRPLTAAYQAVRSDHQVVQDGSRTPQKNSNLVSKAMEYVFGW
ncbi:nucleoporin NUP35-like isoform X2 [Montipora capricornis]|uniref:nucleoporin NUP35-like isoform X2 n=1 Tax=Montipora capricornis TaxID=246305 RepID=UPI0035F1D0EE